MKIICEEILYGRNGLEIAYCSQLRWTEHSHHDYETLEAIKLGLATRLTDEVYGPDDPFSRSMERS